MSGEMRVGISGWNYPPWRGPFYPTGLPHDSQGVAWVQVVPQPTWR